MLGTPDPYIQSTSKGRQLLGVLTGTQAPTFSVITPIPSWKVRVRRWAARLAWRMVKRAARKVLWGRRRVLAPWYLGAAVWVAAALAHLADKGWITIGTLGLGGVPALWWWLGMPAWQMTRRRGLPTISQRWWYAAAYAAYTAWPVIGARWGAGPPRLGYLFTLTLVFWVAWCWRHRIRRAEIAPIALTDVEDRWAKVKGMDGTELLNIVERKDPERIVFDVDLSGTDHLVAKVIESAPHIAKRFGTPQENVVVDYAPGRLEELAHCEIVYDNPLNSPVIYDKKWMPTEEEIAKGIVKFHRYPNGQYAHARLWYPGKGTVNTLFSGDIGQGKSAGQEALMTQAAWTGRVWLMGADPQGGASMPAWVGAGGQARWQAICDPDDLDPIRAQMEFAREAMYHRGSLMGQIKWTNRHGDEEFGLRAWDYDIIAGAEGITHPWPAIGIHIAEFWRVMKEKDLAILAKELLKLMRKVGFYLSMDTQYPGIEEFDNDMSLRQPLTAGNIMCYRNTANTVKNMILPPHLPPPHMIPSETPDGDDTKGMLIAASQAPKSSLPAYSRSVWVERATYWATKAGKHQHDLEPDLQKMLAKYISRPVEKPAEPQRETVVVSQSAPAAPTATSGSKLPPYLDRIEAYLNGLSEHTDGRRARSGVIAADLDIPHPRVSETLRRGEKKSRFHQVTGEPGVWALGPKPAAVDHALEKAAA